MQTVSAFTHGLAWDNLPPAVQHQARRCLLDTLGSAIGGRRTATAAIIHDFAAAAFGGDQAALWQDGRRVSAPGAALANGMTIDALDIHDGYKLTKGHPGAGVVPTLFAGLGLRAEPVSGRELLSGLVVGYEISLRAGVALHASASDYHSSGAWNALGCAAVTARRLGLTAEHTRHALGIAEYHGPRSQIMRVVDFPTMLKDGAGWGAMAGVSAALLAAAGFTGAPALTVEQPASAAVWADLGQAWTILDVYFKPYGVCYWAQPAVVAALELQASHAIAAGQIERIRVRTFEAATHLACSAPQDSDQAQYSLPFPVAAALVHGRLGPAELDGAGLRDPRVLDLAARVEMVEDPDLTAQFPARRFARVEITTRAGSVYLSPPTTARWEPSAPPSDAELREKFLWLAGEGLGAARAAALAELIWNCDQLADAAELERTLRPAG
jgi:2-methylcitrate dehydratase PrpD